MGVELFAYLVTDLPDDILRESEKFIRHNFDSFYLILLFNLLELH